MQIGENWTGMVAGIAHATDKHGAEHAVVVVKGTFDVFDDGSTQLASKQEPLVYADVHYGVPASSSIKYDCDFAPTKRCTDVILNGEAHAPDLRPVQQLQVAFAVEERVKTLIVTGNRTWERGLTGLGASDPAAFLTMPLVYERAFGGSDQSHPDEKHWGSELRNLVGVGFRRNGDARMVAGTPLPNIEYLHDRVQQWSDRPAPAGFGFVSRNWQPRLGFAGTYDDEWLRDRFPFLPHDFDDRYFLSAPADQQVEFLRGGELVRCVNLTPEGNFAFNLPQPDVPLVFRFRTGAVQAHPHLDTLIVEPHRRRFLVTWRAAQPLGRKLSALRDVIVGATPTKSGLPCVGRPHFHSLGSAVDWLRQRRRRPADAKPSQ